MQDRKPAVLAKRKARSRITNGRVESADPNEEVIFNRREEGPKKHGAKVELVDAFVSPLREKKLE
jgi:hypothetical protein